MDLGLKAIERFAADGAKNSTGGGNQYKNLSVSVSGNRLNGGWP